MSVSLLQFARRLLRTTETMQTVCYQMVTARMAGCGGKLEIPIASVSLLKRGHKVSVCFINYYYLH
jgi:hypothetical protein